MNQPVIRSLVHSIVFSLSPFYIGIHAADWPMLGRDATRNSVSPEKNSPVDWDVGTFDPKAGKWTGARNVKWTAQLGSLAFGDPVVADGLVWIGTNNGNHEDIKSVLKCFHERDGKLLYEYISPRLPLRTNDNGWGGIGCSPLIEGDRLWFTTNRCETVCLDIGPLKRGEGEPRIEWKYDMIKELGVFPRALLMGPARTCSVTSYKDFIYVVTGNGVDESYLKVPAPEAPSLVCFNKLTGAVVWTDNSPGENILLGQLASPLIVEVNGRGQVVVPQGDGWLRSFDALTGELVWKFDVNLKTSKWRIGGRGTRNGVLATPVLYDHCIYIAGGQYPEHGEGPGRLCCLDPSKTGDISSQLATNADGKPLPHRRVQAVNPDKGEKAVANPNSGLVWEYTTIDRDGDKRALFEETFHRTISNVTIKNDLLVAADFSGLFHCLNAKTGELYWTYDQFARTWGSPLIVDDKIYVADEDGDVTILDLSATDNESLEEINMGASIYTSPIFANGTLYIASRSYLFAIQADDDATERAKKPALLEKLGSWPQWRGPNRDNISTETGLLKEWPEGGPPLGWRVEGIGTGIASIAVRDGTIYALGYIGDHEYLTALDQTTGRRRWTTRVGPAVREHPYMRHRCQRMPTVDTEFVYALNGHGQLCCLRQDTGHELWRKDYAKDFGVERRRWGILDYPLVDGDRLICLPGGPMWAMVALDKKTGEVIWKCQTAGTDYSSFVAADLGGVPQYVACVAEAVIGVSAKDGEILWKYSKLAHPYHNFTPIVRDEFVVCPSPRRGTVAGLKVSRQDGVFSVEGQYSQEISLDYFQDGVTWIRDHVYSFRHGGVAACVDARTGEIQWQLRTEQRTSLPANVYADGHFYLRDGGRLTLVEANPKKYVAKSAFTLPEADASLGSTFPVIADGHLLVRDDNRLFRYDVRAGREGSPPDTLTVEFAPPRHRDVYGSENASRSVFVPTPHDVVEKMLELANVTKNDLVIDLGSGDGRILIAAAETYGCRAIGYEIDKQMVAESREQVAKRKLESLVTIEQQDIFKAKFDAANVVAVYLLPNQLEMLVPQFEKLKPGTRIVSHQFAIPGVNTEKMIEIESKEDGVVHKLFLWTTPLKKPTRP